ncbi:RNA polymerase sigma factor [Paenibacillus sp. GCM10028914]|uniref:RNA polymerase sigma factor n=1 Tax=Paenibacillus sp. GCM10028914 TaxID=3273416 RepID=UPI003623B9A8
MESTHHKNTSNRERLDVENTILSIQQGDIEQYRVIIEQYQKQLYVYCYYLLKQTEDAQDAVQDIFVKAYQHIDNYKQTVSFSAWIYKIAYNHCMNLNKKRYRDVQLLQVFKNTYQSIVFAKRSSIEEGLESLISHLTFNERHLLLLRAVEDYSFEEIGHVMNITPATARKKYERIRKKLVQKNLEGGYLHEQSLKTTR